MKAHIFDSDGTLIDSMGAWIGINRSFLAKHGIAIPPEDEYNKFVTKILPLTPLQSAAYVIKYFNIDEDAENVMNENNAMALNVYKNIIPLKPGVLDYLQNLHAKGAKMSVATSAPTHLCLAALKNNKIKDLFDAICMTEEVGLGKSSPDVFLLAARRMGVKPEDCIVYDDSLTAIRTAKRIGMTTCGVFDNSGKAEWEELKTVADVSILGFEEDLYLHTSAIIEIPML